MLTVSDHAVLVLRPWFTPEQPGPVIFEHVARTGHGRCRVNRWPDPQVVSAELPGNYALRGDPERVSARDLAGVVGFVEAPPGWLPALRTSDPGTAVWPRVIATLPAAVTVPAGRPRPGCSVRPTRLRWPG